MVENINLSEVGIPASQSLLYRHAEIQCYQFFFFFFFFKKYLNKDLYRKEFYTQHSPKLKKKKKKESRILNVGM